MSTPATTPDQSRVNLWLTVGWIAILVKCALLPWIVSRWQIPVHPAWIIGPTLVFAGTITAIVLSRRRRAEN